MVIDKSKDRKVGQLLLQVGVKGVLGLAIPTFNLAYNHLQAGNNHLRAAYNHLFTG